MLVTTYGNVDEMWSISTSDWSASYIPQNSCDVINSMAVHTDVLFRFVFKFTTEFHFCGGKSSFYKTIDKRHILFAYLHMSRFCASHLRNPKFETQSTTSCPHQSFVIFLSLSMQYMWWYLKQATTSSLNVLPNLSFVDIFIFDPQNQEAEKSRKNERFMDSFDGLNFVRFICSRQKMR